MKKIYEIAMEFFRNESIIKITEGKAQKRFFLIDSNVIPEITDSSGYKKDKCCCGWKKLEENNNICTCGNADWLKQQQNHEFEFVVIYPLDGGDTGTYGMMPKVKIMKKSIGFSFTITKDDPKDLERLEYVYDVTVAARGNQLLIPLAKKVMPDWKKIDKKFPSKITKEEYSALNIHNKEEVINLIKKILN